MNKRIAALADCVGCDVDEIELSGHSPSAFEIGTSSYLVLTEPEANAEAAECVRNSLWAFNASFIVSFLGLDNQVTPHIRKMQEALCEDANEIVRLMIGVRIDEFVSAAIKADGRGHFLAGYDGEEHEADGFYIYRTN